ncbi:Hypothetical protein D9617_4g001130 [Elsinoe fawcettii]|nr:Hypothetical protein D9617_4g001130 [Elsinoe fawcettii]
MSDPRALLSAARQARRITHPYANYTDTAKLQCTLCETNIKSDAAWNSHLKTPEHAKRALRAAEAAKAQSNSRKRKVGSEDEEDDARKRARGESEDAGEMPRTEIGDKEEGVMETLQEQGEAQMSAEVGKAQGIEDDPEWLALQEMLNAPAQDTGTSQRDVYANATISAPAMTAEEIAARAREEQSTQRGRREQELEDEKEDAQEALTAEFEEMDELEERVRKLREKREALRKGSGTVVQDEVGAVRGEVMAGVVKEGNTGQSGEAGIVIQEDEEDDEDDELDDWNFGAD